MDSIVSTDWLQANLDAVRVVDIRGHVLPASDPPPHYFSHHDDYKESHIPGAVFVDWTSDITDPDSPHGMQIAQPDAYAALMSRLGIGDSTQVVIYDDANGMFSARLWWSLRYYGHEQAAILAGGWQKWVAEGRPVTADLPQIAPATFTPRLNESLRRDMDAVQASLHGAVQLLDVRSPGEYNGESSRAVRAGHIPGALNLPGKSLFNADGTLLDADSLRAELTSAGLDDPSAEVVVYCNAGVSASLGLLALEQAGFENVAVYDGSWKEWANDPNRPIE